jgi:hypothetical protein
MYAFFRIEICYVPQLRSVVIFRGVRPLNPQLEAARHELAQLWALAYLPAALRRVYGLSRPASWLEALARGGVHLSVIVALIVGAELVAILKHG